MSEDASGDKSKAKGRLGVRARPDVDWEAVEVHYRAGKLTLSEISQRYGVSRPAIEKRAAKGGWVRDQSEKIDRATKAKVIEQVAQERLQIGLQEGSKQVAALAQSATQLYAEAAADVDMQGRRDVSRALAIQRSMLGELEALSDPDFRERLEWLGEVMKEERETPSGTIIRDKVNELYQYVISLAGRIKSIKELASAHGVYIPLQRKQFGLEGSKGETPFESLLERLGEQASRIDNANP